MSAHPTKWPNYSEGDFIIRSYVFRSGEILPELKLHYRTLGTPKRDAAGRITNGVLLLQGNTGTGANWLRPSLADELFGPGQPLDAAQHFMILQDRPTRRSTLRPLCRAAKSTTYISTVPLCVTGEQLSCPITQFHR